MSVLGKTWKLRTEKRTLPLRETLLQNRGIAPHDERHFFDDTEELHDPFKMGEMKGAVARIRQALAAKETILIFGDYDVDGLTGAAILVRVFRALGVQVLYRIPHRHKEGYGLSKAIVEECHEKKVRLMITVDCGITAAEEIHFAHKKGIDVIVTDHHSVPKTLPREAIAIIHPALPNSPYPFPHLTGSAVAYKLAQALVSTILPQKDWAAVLLPLLDLAAMGTIADMAPLIGENRTIVRRGLRMLRDTHHHGLRALKEKAGITPEEWNNADIVGFRLGPRLNAASRLANPLTAFHLLIDDGKESAKLADTLHTLNAQRRDITDTIMETLEERHGKAMFEKKMLMDWDAAWPIGVLGLVAGKWMDRYGRPTILMEDRGDELWGSGRSVPGFDITQALGEMSHLLDHFGGHAQACGFRMQKKHVEKMSRLLRETVERTLSFEQLIPALDLECAIAPEELHLNTIQVLDAFAPFGIGNPRPLFLVEKVRILSNYPVGKTGDHLQMMVQAGEMRLPVIAFQCGKVKEWFRPGKIIDCAVELLCDRFSGKEKLKLRLVDAR